MKEKNIILHLGWHKTATTSLQHIFSNIKNILYLGRPYTENVFRLMAYFTYTNELFFDEKKFNEEFKQYLDMHDESLVLISDEHLTPISISSPIRYKRIKKCFPKAKIILTIRNQADVLKSLYVHKFHKKKAFSQEHFNEWLNSGLKEKWERAFSPSHRITDQGAYINPTAFDYFKSVQEIEKLFGQENIDIFLFEDYVTDYNKFMTRLFETMGISTDEIPFDTAPALNSKESKKKRIFPESWRKLLMSNYRSDDRNPSKKLAVNTMDILETKIASHNISKKNISLSEELKQKTHDFYMSGNQRLAKKYNLDLVNKGYFE